MRMLVVPFLAGVMSVSLAAATRPAAAKEAAQNGPQDRIEVLSHFPLPQGPVSRLLATQHYSRYYLYAQDVNGRTVSVIDVTNAKAPFLLANASYPVNRKPNELLAAAGTATLIAHPAGASEPSASQSVRIVSFADPAHPAVIRTFTGVTAIGRDRQRGLVFLANPQGLWILTERRAEDPAVVRAYTKYVIYSH